MAVKVAGSSLSFSKQPLDVALRELANLGFSFVDIGAIEGWAHINPSEVASQPQKFVEKLPSNVRAVLAQTRRFQRRTWN
jgi:hypothetical protein